MLLNCSALFRSVSASTVNSRDVALDAPAGRIQVLAHERLLDVLRRESLRRQAFAIDPDAHRILALAADHHRRHARAAPSADRCR